MTADTAHGGERRLLCAAGHLVIGRWPMTECPHVVDRMRAPHLCGLLLEPAPDNRDDDR